MRREWTKQEESYMEKKYLKQPVEETAYRLNRSISSVEHKASRMKLNHYTDGLNARTVANCFGVDTRVVIRWINKFELPCRKVECSNQTRYIIENDEFWKWAEQHKEIINWSKYERMSLFPEPKWLYDTIKNYKTVKTRQKYTEYEIVRIKSMLHKGLSYREIANQLGRSYYGISDFCRKIYL